MEAEVGKSSGEVLEHLAKWRGVRVRERGVRALGLVLSFAARNASPQVSEGKSSLLLHAMHAAGSGCMVQQKGSFTQGTFRGSSMTGC